MASGDITPSTPRTDTVLQFKRLTIDVSGANVAEVTFVDGLGMSHVVTVMNGTSVGFNYATNAPFAIATPTGFTDLMTQLTLTNAKKTAAIQSLVTGGIVVVTGAVA